MKSTMIINATKSYLGFIFGLMLMFVVMQTSHCQPVLNVKHVYGFFTDLYILELKPDKIFTLKVGQDDNLIITGDYFISSDSLRLMNHIFPGKRVNTKDRIYRTATMGLSVFSIYDSLLIPVTFNTPLPLSTILAKDSDTASVYRMEGGELDYQVTLMEDSSFIYQQIDNNDYFNMNGTWEGKDKNLILKPQVSEHYVNHISSGPTFRIIGNFIVGQAIKKNGETGAFYYLVRTKSKFSKTSF